MHGAGKAPAAAPASPETDKQLLHRKRSVPPTCPETEVQIAPSPSPNTSAGALVQAYKDALIVKAEELILKGVPKKILELNELLETAHFRRTSLSEVHQTSNIPVPDPNAEQPATKKCKYDTSVGVIQGTKVTALGCDSLLSNKHVCDLQSVVQHYNRQLINDANLIQMWISVMIPKIECGNNFGVTIQKNTLNDIKTVKAWATIACRFVSAYLSSRGKLVSKVYKYPNIEDYRRAVQEVDETEYARLWENLGEVRDGYCAMHDAIIKNLEKLKKPRPYNIDSLY